MHHLLNLLDKILSKKATWLDTFLLSLFTVLITYHPYFLHTRINFYEWGIYFPVVNDVLSGKVPQASRWWGMPRKRGLRRTTPTFERI